MRIISKPRRAQRAGQARVIGAEAALRDRGLRLTRPRHAVLAVVRAPNPIRPPKRSIDSLGAICLA
jgi:hypothetical protein